MSWAIEWFAWLFPLKEEYAIENLCLQMCWESGLTQALLSWVRPCHMPELSLKPKNSFFFPYHSLKQEPAGQWEKSLACHSRHLKNCRLSVVSPSSFPLELMLCQFFWTVRSGLQASWFNTLNSLVRSQRSGRGGVQFFVFVYQLRLCTGIQACRCVRMCMWVSSAVYRIWDFICQVRPHSYQESIQNWSSHLI